MDRLSQLRGGAGGSRDTSLDGSVPGDSFLTANETPSKYYSLSEDDSFDIAKDVSLATATTQNTLNDDCLISNLSPIGKKDMLDYKIGKQIEAANILSGGVDIFEDNDNSYDGNELVIDDNVETDDKSLSLKSPDSSDSQFHKGDGELAESTLIEDMGGSKETEVMLQIDGKNVDAINIGNGLYLYRKEGQEELAAVQIIDDDQHQPSFKFLKVRENAEGNLEVYEEIEIEVPKDAPVKEGKPTARNPLHVPIKNINKVISDPGSSKIVEKKIKTPDKEVPMVTTNKLDIESSKDVQVESKTELNFNGKMVKYSESRKSPLMAYHSTPNKEGIPLTKTMVDQQLQPSRHSDNIKKTIEVHTDSSKQRILDTPIISKEASTSPEKKSDEAQELDKPCTKDVLDQKETREIAKKTISDSMEMKDNVTDILDKKDEGKDTNQFELKDSNKDELEHMDTKGELPIDNKEGTKEEESPSTIPDNLGTKSDSSIINEINNKSNEKDSETSAVNATQNNRKDGENDDIGKVMMGSSHQLPENKETKENDIILTETIDSEAIEINENALVIEDEQELINSQPEILELKEQNNKTLEPSADVNITLVEDKQVKIQEIEEKVKPKQVVPSTEVKSTVVEDQFIIQKLTENDKSNNLKPSLDVKPMVVEYQMKCQALKDDHADDVPLTEVKAGAVNERVQIQEVKEKMSDTEVIAAAVNEIVQIQEVKEKRSDKPGLPLKMKEKEINNPEIIDSSGNEVKVIHISDSIKDSEVLKCTETKSNRNEKTESLDINADNISLEDAIKEINRTDIIAPDENNLTEVKTAGMESDVSKIEIKSSANTFDYNLMKTPSKLENLPEVSDKKEPLTLNHRKVSEDFILLKREQSNTNLPSNTQNAAKLNSVKSDVNPVVIKAAETKTDDSRKSESSKQNTDTKPKLINNNHAPVPFGKWTEANRQDFLNKIKESKVPVNSSNANQLKQPNDLNRRDVLKKIDSQRQTYNASVKVQESLQKGNIKTETAFASKSVPKRESKVPLKSEASVVKPKPILIKKPVQETVEKDPEPSDALTNTTKQETQRKEINNQDLIDKTIEGIINRAVAGKSPEDTKNTVIEKTVGDKSDNTTEQSVNEQPSLLDAIEIKMNELHGIPFVERPLHELPRPYATDLKVSPKPETQPGPQKLSKIPNLLPLMKSEQKLKDCEDEIMKHELSQDTVVKSAVIPKVASKAIEKLSSEPAAKPEAGSNTTKKDTIIIEKEFEKFERRTSVTYENNLTVTDPHQVLETVVPREVAPKKISRNEQMLAEAKAKSPHKHQVIRQYMSKGASKYTPADTHNKQYQSKLQMAYQTALTAKRHMDSPITIIEDKPVKVVYLESSGEFNAGQLNVQGRDLSPARRAPDSDNITVGTCDSLDSDLLDAMEDVKYQDETKTKSKHQRKQVLTPVDTPELELIEPGDLGIEVSPKKKRRTEDKPEKNLKNLVPKKSYLLGRNTPRAETSDPQVKVPPREATTQLSLVGPPVHNDAVSAIDNLVKAAELLENQYESISGSPSVQNADSPQNTPVKRGRGRPRKYPLPESSPNTSSGKAPSPQKKPRLIDAKAAELSSSDEDSNDEDALIKENWTMGKINEDIVCPICSKLFRSENVVFKHVKHCTGPSPSRSESGKGTPRRSRLSRESEGRPRVSRHDDLSPVRTPHRKRKSKDSKSTSSNDDAIQVQKDPKLSEKNAESIKDSQKSIKSNLMLRTGNIVCEICGKSFRQLSYLISHKLQHKKDEPKLKKPVESQSTEKNVFSCETCQKEFRKLHHLVQHRLIHNPVPVRSLRKTSSEQKEIPKIQEASKVEDQSAGFRCEPCDKSFRKLHHLVEHRETHDGINRQRSNSLTQVNPEKPTPSPQCDICKKTFRKLHHLIEHKDQHLETSSEKSDDQKSVKSSLSTKDIIHECNLCYMVFPNEHSLTKHTVICLRKKRQSAAKQAAAREDKTDEDSANANTAKPEESLIEIIDEPQSMDTDSVEEETKTPQDIPIVPPTQLEIPQIKDDPLKNEKLQTTDKSEKQLNEPTTISEKKVAEIVENPITKVSNKTVEVPQKIKQADEIIVIEDTPVKKKPVKDKAVLTVTRRQKSIAPPPAVKETSAVTSSDDDEVRYMFNPNFKIDETAESKNFMKVRAKKRSSLQIERPNSKDLVRKRSLLQHPPKIPRLRAKSDDTKISLNLLAKHAIKPKLEKVDPVPSTDSDDSDVKYSFPKTVPEKTAQTVKQEPAAEKKRRKTMAEKRKSLSGIAKRKSLGKAIVKTKPSPTKPVKRRTLAAEHRCDCGQLFSSAALLARHASLAHTPPRLRRPRDAPAPAPAPVPALAPAQHKSAEKKPRTSVRNDETVRKTCKSDARKSVSATVKTAVTRNRPHGGVPIPEKRAPRK